MYAALWIDSDQPTANKKIVVCKPLLGRQGAAIAVLNSEKREDASVVILSGDGSVLRQMIGELDKADEEWDLLSDDQLVGAIIAMAKTFGVSPVEFGDVDAEDIANAYVVLAIRRIPKPKAYPRLISKEGKALWDEITKKHKKIFDKYKSEKRKMWAAAIIIYKRYASAKGIKPFTKDPELDKVRKTAITHINRRANNGNYAALEATEDLFTRLKAAKLVSRLTAEKFYEVAHHRDKYYITTYRKMGVRRGVDPIFVIDTVRGMPSYAGRRGKYAHLSLNEVTDLLVQPGEGGDKSVYLYLATYLTQDQVILLFDLPDDVSEAKILKLVGTAGRRWVKTGELVRVPK